MASNKIDLDLCSTCTNKYNRTRSTFCQCKHCSIPFCLDCMKEHHDELLQDLEVISLDYNQLQEVLQMKRTMIAEQTAQSIEIVNEYFERYIQQLHETRAKLIENMNQSMDNAKNALELFERNLRKIGDGMQSVVKEGMVQTSKMQDLTQDFNQIQQQIKTYQIIRTENFIQTQPDYSIRFDSVVEAQPQPPPPPPPPQQQQELLMTTWEPSAIPKFPKRMRLSNENSSSDDNSSSDSDNFIETSYKIDRMASNGQHILYSSQKLNGSDRIAYCLMDEDAKYEDECHNWKYSRIQDMIWWKKIKEFLCATFQGIYAVKYAKEKFKIDDVIDGKWSDIRLAVNSEHLFVWMKSTEKNFHGIRLYSSEFKSVRKIDFNKYEIEPFINANQGFCVTNEHIVTSYVRKENCFHLLQVVCCDLNMKNLKTISLNENQNVEQIRTDGEKFFLTVGRSHLWTIDAVDLKSASIYLGIDAKLVEIFENQRLGVSTGSKEIQLINY